MEWTRLPAYVGWLVVLAGESAIASFVFVKPMDPDQTVFTLAVFTAFQVALLVVAVRLRARSRAADESALTVLVLLFLVAYALFLAQAVAEVRGLYGVGNGLGDVAFFVLVAAAGVCVWTSVLSRLAASVDSSTT